MLLVVFFVAHGLLPCHARAEASMGCCTCCVQVQNASVVIPTTGLVSGEAIRAAPKLRLIAQPATGYNNIDVDAASALGIPVCTAPGAAWSPGPQIAS